MSESFYGTNSPSHTPIWTDPFSEEFQFQFPPPAEIPFSPALPPAAPPPRRPSIVKSPSGLARFPSIGGDPWFPALRGSFEWDALDSRRLSFESVGRRPSRTFCNDWSTPLNLNLTRRKSSIDFAALPKEDAERAFAELQKRLEREYDGAGKRKVQVPHRHPTEIAGPPTSSPDRVPKHRATSTSRDKRSSSSIKRATAGMKKDAAKPGGTTRTKLNAVQEKIASKQKNKSSAPSLT